MGWLWLLPAAWGVMILLGLLLMPRTLPASFSQPDTKMQVRSAARSRRRARRG